MGVWGRLASVFGSGSGGSMRRGVSNLAPDEPVLNKWPPPAPPDDAPKATNGESHHADDAGIAGAATQTAEADPDHPEPHDVITPASSMTHTPSRKPSRQDLIDELRGNYAEVIDLVRRVNSHLDSQADRLDAQDRRAERLAEIAEKIPEALAVLPQIREQNERLVELSGRMVEAISELASATRDGQRSIEDAFIEQARAGREAAERSESLLARSAEIQQRAAEAQDQSVASLGELGQTLGASSDRMAGLLNDMQHRAGERDAHLAEMIARSQRWFILAMVLCVSAIVIAGVAVVMILT